MAAMHRTLLGAVLLLGAASPTVARAAEPAAGGTRPGLQDRLTTGLRVQRPEDAAFIKEVVDLVNSGDLPVKLVDSTYLWALQRQRKYPFPAFERALRLQAGRLGVGL
ncbi:MAG: hypothetical protein EBR28_12630 [Planctomycetia bacterium]|nr:hypothetical protein [Planctomycetia bacterium]